MITIANEFLIVNIKLKGAELCSVVHKQHNLEYMWSGDSAVWGKTSPLLFPIVGTLKGDKYIYDHKEYNLPRHGFARDMEFELVDRKKDSAVFSLTSSAASKEKYPFDFVLLMRYHISYDTLHVSYDLTNTGNKEMFFSIGGHPAFAVPLTKDLTYKDYYLEFNQIENANRWPISKEGLIEDTAVPLINNSKRLDLQKSLFQNDAIVFKHLRSNMVSLKSNANDRGLDFHFRGFPYLGIWAAKNADFVCIEPWCGIADGVSHNQQLEEKEGIERIEATGAWSREWKIRFY